MLPRQFGLYVLKALKALDKVLTADDKTLNAQYVKAKAWPMNAVSVSTEDLRREFCKRLGLKVLLDINQLKKTIREGVQKGIWIYYLASEGIGYGEPSPNPMVEISEDATLYTLEEAKRVGIKIKGAEPDPQICPVCSEISNLPRLPIAICLMSLCHSIFLTLHTSGYGGIKYHSQGPSNWLAETCQHRVAKMPCIFGCVNPGKTSFRAGLTSFEENYPIDFVN